MKALDEPIAPACAAVLNTVPTDRVASTRFHNIPYDDTANAGALRQRGDLELGLYRVRVSALRPSGL